jgi:hypothetical protein
MGRRSRNEAPHSSVQGGQPSAVLACQREQIGVRGLLVAANLWHQLVIRLQIVRPKFVSGMRDPHANRPQRIGDARRLFQVRGDAAEAQLGQRTSGEPAHAFEPLPGLEVASVVWPRQGD